MAIEDDDSVDQTILQFRVEGYENTKTSIWESNELWFSVAFVSTVLSMLIVVVWQMEKEDGWWSSKKKKDEDQADKKDSLSLIRGAFGKKPSTSTVMSDLESIHNKLEERKGGNATDGKYVHFARCPAPEEDEEDGLLVKPGENGTSLGKTSFKFLEEDESQEDDACRYLKDNETNLHGKLATAQMMSKAREIEKRMSKQDREKEAMLVFNVWMNKLRE